MLTIIHKKRELSYSLSIVWISIRVPVMARKCLKMLRTELTCEATVHKHWVLWVKDFESVGWSATCRLLSTTALFTIKEKQFLSISWGPHKNIGHMWECYSEVKCIAICYKLMQLEVLVLRETSQITHQVLNDFPDVILTRWCDRLQRQGLGKIGG